MTLTIGDPLYSTEAAPLTLPLIVLPTATVALADPNTDSCKLSTLRCEAVRLADTCRLKSVVRTCPAMPSEDDPDPLMVAC